MSRRGRRARTGKDESPWYDIEDMQRLFDVSERTVTAWIADGTFPEPARKGKRWVRWPKTQIDELLAKWAQSGQKGRSA